MPDEQGPVEPRVRLVWNTPEPKHKIALAARMCYSAKDVSKLAEDLGPEEIDRMVKHILSARHVSVLRHVIFCFTIEGVSRSFSHQFVRHHVGVDVEQRSQHYRRERQFSYNLPAMLEDNDDLRATYEAHMAESQQVYDDLVAEGVDKSEARQVLPNACETQMIVTMNLNAIMNVVSQRACRLNTPEILKVAVQIRKLVGQVMPEALEFLGPTCWSGICYEGEKFFKSCNRPWQSPTVLWSKDFPRETTYVGIRDGAPFKDTQQWKPPARGGQAALPLPEPPRVEPSEAFQLEQGKDSRNQS